MIDDANGTNYLDERLGGQHRREDFDEPQWIEEDDVLQRLIVIEVDDRTHLVQEVRG